MKRQAEPENSQSPESGLLTIHRTIRLVALAALAALGIACGDGTAPPPAVATVAISPSDPVELVPGATRMLVATAKDAAGATIADRITSWSSSDASKATVEAGLVSAVAVGSAVVNASVDGKSASVGVIVKDGAIVTPSGRTFSDASGRLSVSVPANALAQDLNLTVAQAVGAPPSLRLLAGSAFELGPAAATFAQPITLTIRYDPALVSAGHSEHELQLYMATGTTWQVVPGSEAETDGNTVSGNVLRLGTYAVMLRPRVETVAIGGDLGPLSVVAPRQLTAMLKDIDGATLDRPVSWSSSDESVLSVDATGRVSGRVPGSATVTASSEGKSATAAITVTPGPPAKLIPFAGNNQSVAAGAAVPTPPSVLVTDALDNPVSGAPVAFSVATGGGTVTGGAATTNASGIAAVGSWTLGIVAGPNSLTATSTAISGVTVTFNAAGGAGPPAKIEAASGGQSATAGGLVRPPPAVKVTDAVGNPVSGVAVTFAPGSGSGSVTAGAGSTNEAGIAAVGGWRLGTTPGAQTLLASAPGLSGSPVTFTVTAVAPVASTVAGFAGNNQTARPGTVLPVPPSVIVTDTAGIPVAGVTVSFSVTAGGGVINGGEAVTSADGIARVGSWTLGAAPGVNTLSAASPGLTGSPVIFNAVAEVPRATSIGINGGNNQTAVVGEAVAIPPSVRITGADGAGVADVPVTFAVASGGGSITGASTVTNGSGIATVGSWNVGASGGTNTLVATSPELSGASVTFTATGEPRPANKIEASDGSGSGVAGELIANPPSVLVTSPSGQPVGGVTVTFVVGLGNGQVIGSVATTDALGIGRVGGWRLGPTPGHQTLLAVADGLSGSPVIFNVSALPAGPGNLAIAAGNNQSARPGFAVATPPAVIVTGQSGTPLPGVAVTFTVTAGGGSVAGGDATTGADGIASVGSWTLGPTPGANTLTATAGGYSVEIQASGVLPGASTISIHGGNNQNALAGQAVPVRPSVKVTDSDGLGVAGVTVTFSVLSGGGSVSGGTAVSDAQGIATVGNWVVGLGSNSLSASAPGLNGNPLTFFALGSAAVQVVTFGDSNTDVGYQGTQFSPVVASYVSSSNLRLSPSAANHNLQLAGKIEDRWKSNRAATITVVNHGISGTRTGAGRTTLSAPNALEQVDGVSRFRGEVLGDAYPWSGGESGYGPIPRTRAFTPRSSDFAYVSMGTNDIIAGASPASVAANLGAMVDEWLSRGLPANRFFLTTIPPYQPGTPSANIPALNDAIRSLAAAKGVRLIDIAAHVSGDNGLTWSSASLHVGDSLHYAESVRDWIADQVVSVILSLVP